MILWWKRIHKPRRALSEFLRIFLESSSPKSILHPRTEIFLKALLTPKSSICCYVFKYFVLTNLFFCLKTVYFDRKIFKFSWNLHRLEATIWTFFFEKCMLWVVSFFGINAFLPIWIIFALDFYCYILRSGYCNRKF